MIAPQLLILNQSKFIMIMTFIVSEKFFSINKKVVDLSKPFFSDNREIRVFKSSQFIVIDSKLFNLQYDGIQFFKVRECGHKVCGICGNHNNNDKDDKISYEKYLAETNTNAQCKP